MPQLEQIDTFLAQIFWLFVCFGAIYFFLAKKATPKLANIIENRENTISSNVNAAEDYKNRFVETSTALEKSAATSRMNAMSIISESTQQSNALYDKGISQTDEALKQSVDLAEGEILAAKKAAVADLNKNIADFVEEIVNKLSDIKGNKNLIEKIVTKLNS